MDSNQKPVIIVGAGLAGLTCATELFRLSQSFVLLEAADAVGGRVRTDEVEGFLLDRGFQVLLTAYPETQRFLDYSRLDLKAFLPGATIYHGGRFCRFVDPWREPTQLLQTAFSSVGNLVDKLRVARVRSVASRGRLVDVLTGKNKTTADVLREDYHFTSGMIDQFFRPFLGGVFLDRDLETTSRMLHFVFRMFSQGDTAVPAHGMQAIPDQLAVGLPTESLRLNTRVQSVTQTRVTLESGEILDGRAVVVATDGLTASLLCSEIPKPKPPRSVTGLYFACDQSPVAEPILILNGESQGPVNNVAVMSQVSSGYAPEGQHLISVSVLEANRETLESEVRQQLKSWFGDSVDQWRHLRTYEIPAALPDQSPASLEPASRTRRLECGVYVCGDHCENGSINGAMASGRLTAEAIASSMS
ncbi:NAD(P)/FAD-dependent oxidoreductase [Thalassoroseus pseudoceratinae]|uniref:NAD(P)/FAD-dependent oxidoreductase n=1 Tax=Thalassoroseus pseudoceratinae TaxID=2713176 RepID=UPI0014217D8B|nr:NAD(P)/FAD-dependent oxidoreductase [Thalassoroseus pseudoceratinae]